MSGLRLRAVRVLVPVAVLLSPPFGAEAASIQRIADAGAVGGTPQLALPQTAQGNTGASNANPVRKVVNLLENMAKKVEKEGEKEKDLYESFKCYCTTGNKDLSTAIADSTAKVPAVQSDIEEGTAKLGSLKEELKQHQGDRHSAKEALEKANSIREKDHAGYLDQHTELQGYVDALSQAIPAIMNGMSGTKLLQGTLSRRQAAALRKATQTDVELTDNDRQGVLMFLGFSDQSQNEDGEQYVPAATEVVGMLKTMKEEFEKSLKEVNDEEAASLKIYEDLVAAKGNEVDTLSASIEKKTARIGELSVELVHMKADLTDTEAALIENQKFLSNLASDCKSKDEEFQERVKMRGEELVAIHETIKILNDDDALDLFKKTLPSPSFVQVRDTVRELQRRGIVVLQKAAVAAAKASGGSKDTTDSMSVRFLEFMLSGRKVDFSKILKMIDEMIALLKEEQRDDEDKKEYCTIQIDHTEDKAKALHRTAEDLHASLEERETAIKSLAEEIKTLQEGIEDLDKSVLEATAQRKKENEEFTELMASDAAAKELLEFAEARLRKFYTPKLALPQTASKGQEKAISVSASAVAAAAHSKDATESKVKVAVVAGKAKQAPEPAPTTWEGNFKKKDEESSGVIQMINLLIRDLEKEMAAAENGEEHAQKTYEELMNDSAAKRAKDVKSISVKESSKADSEMLVSAETGDLSSTQKEFMAVEQYKAQLHGECDWLVQNFDLRKEARGEEMENLQSAKAVLSGADFALLQHRTEAPATEKQPMNVTKAKRLLR